jgi:hypothetical protein
VIVSDTVRQRRSRTPISATPESSRESNLVVMPDLLPHAKPASTASKEMQERDEDGKSVSSTRTGQIVDTVSILESCNQFEPQQVETVHIIDASSDTDTANSTPQPRRRTNGVRSNGSFDELQTELERELKTISNFDEEESNEFHIEKKRISYEEKRKVLEKDRDVLLDSELAEKKVISMMKLRPTLQELLMEERNSFYSADKDNDEPLEFSDDEEIPRFSVEIDSDSDLVTN